ncbi:MAG: hypothetical protein ACTHJW_01740 [Streptosporangiaceae bacterium]
MTDPPAWAGAPPYPGSPGYGQAGHQGGWNMGSGQGRSGAGWDVTTAPVSGGIPLRPLGAGDILSGSFTLIRQNPAATLGLTASVVTALAVAVLAIFVIAVNTSGAVLLLAVPVALSAFALQVGGLAAAMGRAVLGRKLSITEAVRLSRTGWVLLTIVVLTLATAVIWVPLIMLLKGWGVIPALLLTAWLAVMASLAVPVVVLERRGPFAAIGRSWRLILNSYWRVFGIFCLTYLITSTISFVINLPLGFASGLVGSVAAGSKATVSVALVIYAIGEIVIASLTGTIEIGVIVLVYADMRMRKEGMDLVLRQAAQSQQLTGDEFAASGFSSAYTGGAAPGGVFTGGGYPGGAYPGGAYPGGAYPGAAYAGGAYPCTANPAGDQGGFADGTGWDPPAGPAPPDRPT